MELKDFKKQPRAPYSFNRWIRDKPVATALGEFTVDLHVHSDKNPPDDEMLRRAAELVRYMEQHGDYVLDVLYGDYLRAAEDGYMDALLELEGAEGLTRENVCDYLGEGSQGLIVARDPEYEDGYESAIYLIPEWDDEHALSLVFRDGKIVTVNDEPFTLVDGVLRYELEEDEE
jgi:hypothetical protein